MTSCMDAEIVLYATSLGAPCANFDRSGTTRLGTKLFDHSYFVPMLILNGTTTLVGSLIGTILY